MDLDVQDEVKSQKTDRKTYRKIMLDILDEKESGSMIFDLFDENNDGSLTWEEAKTGLMRLKNLGLLAIGALALFQSLGLVLPDSSPFLSFIWFWNS